MTSPDSIALIHRAKAGDRDAWEALCLRYYPQWLAGFHGQLGAGLRESNDTLDLVQSAIGDALRDIKSLRNEAAFYTWVSAIIRRKIAEKRRDGSRLEPLALAAVAEPAAGEAGLTAAGATEEDYLRVLDAILGLFHTYPEAMAVVYLKYFERLDIASLGRLLRKSERSSQRLLQTALALLRSRLGQR